MINLREDINSWIERYELEEIEDCRMCGEDLPEPLIFATKSFRGIRYKCDCGNTPFSVAAIADTEDLSELEHVDKL